MTFNRFWFSITAIITFHCFTNLCFADTASKLISSPLDLTPFGLNPSAISETNDGEEINPFGNYIIWRDAVKHQERRVLIGHIMFFSGLTAPFISAFIASKVYEDELYYECGTPSLAIFGAFLLTSFVAVPVMIVGIVKWVRGERAISKLLKTGDEKGWSMSFSILEHTSTGRSHGGYRVCLQYNF